MATQSVSVTKSGTGFTVDVTAANLLEDLSVRDFEVFHDGALTSKADYAKTSRTLLTYSGASLPANTPVLVRRKTPNVVVQNITYADRFSSSLWNDELDRIIRWREEIDNTASGGLVPVLIGNNGFRGNNEFDGLVTIVDDTQSASSSTGALVVDGGVGVKKNLNIAGTLDVNGDIGANNNLSADGTLTIGGASTIGGALSVDDLTQASSSSTGALVVGGGVGIGKDLRVAGDIYVTDDLTVQDNVVINGLIINPMTINDTTESTSTSTGSLIVKGGVGIAKNVFISGTLNNTGAITSVGTVNITNTTQSVDSSTGSLVADGGVGIKKNLNVAGTVDINGNIGANGTLTLGGVATLSSALVVDSTVDSTTPLTGSIQTDGGLGVVKDVFVGGDIFANELTATGGDVFVRSSLSTDSPVIRFVNDVSNEGIIFLGRSGIGIDSGNMFVSNQTNGKDLILRAYNAGGTPLKGLVVDPDVPSVTVPFFTTTTSKTTGALIVTGGAGFGGNINASGLSFNNSANVMSHYSEGTFTITNDGDATGVLSAQACEYTRVGNLVHVRIVFTVDTNFTANSIAGLPFSPVNQAAGISSVSAFAPVLFSGAGTNNVFAYATTTNKLFFVNDANTTNNHPPTTSPSLYRVSLTYRTA
jgi:enhancing lycopene biosynthesis protein 2